MAILLTTTIGPAGNFPLIQSEDVGMPDGSRLSNLSVSYPVEEANTDILPERYYAFGEVEHLEINLVKVDDGKAHEYYFEFIPTENFAELKITPEPKWAREPQYPAGKTCQVSILQGIGVSVNA